MDFLAGKRVHQRSTETVFFTDTKQKYMQPILKSIGIGLYYRLSVDLWGAYLCKVLHCTLEKMRVSPSLPILETAVMYIVYVY